MDWIVIGSGFGGSVSALRLVEKAFPAFNADQTTFRPVNQRPNMLFFSWYPDYNQPSDYLFPIVNSAAVPPNGYNSGYYANPTVDKAINDGFTLTNAGTGMVTWSGQRIVLYNGANIVNQGMFTINTDGPYLLNTHLRYEYDLLSRAGILDDAQIERTIATARAATFVR